MAEKLTMGAQRAPASTQALAREFRGKGHVAGVQVERHRTSRTAPAYDALAENSFGDWRLVIDGHGAKPLSLSLDDLKEAAVRTQITRHDCVEGWSAIGKWTGVPLGLLLKAAGSKPDARYVVFHCADEYEKTLDGSGRYYESIDLVDAFHPQTILAYGMNGGELPIPHGAPLRLRGRAPARLASTRNI